MYKSARGKLVLNVRIFMVYQVSITSFSSLKMKISKIHFKIHIRIQYMLAVFFDSKYLCVRTYSFQYFIMHINQFMRRIPLGSLFLKIRVLERMCICKMTNFGHQYRASCAQTCIPAPRHGRRCSNLRKFIPRFSEKSKLPSSAGGRGFLRRIRNWPWDDMCRKRYLL